MVEYQKALKISVIIPIKANSSAELALAALSEMDYPQELIEVFIVEGNQPARQRNEAVKEAQGDILYFLDDDSESDKDLFSKVVEIYDKDKQAMAVGGPMLMQELNGAFWPKVSKNILSSFFGVLRKRARYFPVGSLRQASEDDIILCNFSIRREIFVKENGFNEQLYPNEENELFLRLWRNSYKILYAPQARIYRLMKVNLVGFLKSIFNYGKGRSEQAWINPSLYSLFHFSALGLLFYLVALPFLSQWVFFIPFFAYISADLIISLKIAVKEKSLALGFALPFSFFLTHTAYPLGLIWGLLARPFAIKKAQSLEIRVKKVKNFGQHFNNQEENRLYLDFYGISSEAISLDQNCLSEIKRDFSHFKVDKLKRADVRITILNQYPPYENIPPLPASLYMPDFVAYDCGHKRYVDYNGQALVIYDYQQEQGKVYSLDKNLLHEIAYLLLLSRVGELLDKKGIHRLHGLGFTFNDKAVLCLLPSNGGKTTLILDLLKDERVKLISEDTPLVTRGGKILPFPIRIGVSEMSSTVIPSTYLRSFQRRRYGLKTLIDIEFFQDKIEHQAVSYDILLIGERRFSKEAYLAKINKSKAIGPLMRNLIFGLGLPQLVEYFLRHNLSDIIRKIRMVISRTFTALILLHKTKVYRFTLGQDYARNKQTLLDFLAKEA